MQAWLAKPIDRWVIQLADRAMPRSPAAVRKADDLVAHARFAGFESGRIRAPEVFLAGDGRFQFASSVATASPRNNLVFGRLFRAGDAWSTKPTAILLHGWNAELCYSHMFPHLASRLRRAGMNTAMIELPYHMHRRPRNGPVNDFISGDLQSMLEATMQSVADVRALCRWLEAQGSTSIGLWGFSLGAWLAGLIVREEPGLRCAVLTTPIAEIDRAIAELPFCETVRRGLNGRSFDFGELNLAARAPALDPRNMLLVESRHDQFAPAETVERLWEAWRRPDIWRVPHGHISVLMSLPIMRRTVGWIASRLSPPPRE